MTRPSDLVQGTLELLLLKIVALEPQHGWAISQRLRQISDQQLQASDGSVYPALQKLELADWVTSEWRTSDMGRRAKFYALTPAGRRRLVSEADEWQRLSSAVGRVLRLRKL
jgi:PadR family transcriptional regulator, regulatory protein PadR